MENKCTLCGTNVCSCPCYFVLSGQAVFKAFYLGFVSPYPSPLPANRPDVLRKVTTMMLHLENDEIDK